jgi:DNA-binding MarR family transcriptional regulator
MPRPQTARKAQPDGPDPMVDGGLEALLGFHVRMANVAIYRDFTASMAKLDITQRQAATLSLVEANPGTSQVAIANKLNSDRATIMAMVDRLEARGLLTRTRSREDRRRQELYLTPLGQKTCKDARALIAEHERRFTSMFTTDELEAFIDALKRVHG